MRRSAGDPETIDFGGYFTPCLTARTPAKFPELLVATQRREQLREEKHRRGSLPIILGVAVACGTAGIFGVGAAIAQSPPSENEFHLAELTRPGDAKDSLPAEVIDASQATHMEQSIQPDSSRFLGEKGGVSYWTGLNGEGEVCLMVFLGKEEWVSGQSCTTQEMFLSSGAALRLYGPEGLVEAYLVPDGVQPGGPTSQVTENVYTVDPYLEDSQRAMKQRTDGNPEGFQLALFDEAFSLDGPR